jgi:hypothetical protein
VSDRSIARYRLVTGRLTASGIELHVLARAYWSAWIALHSEAPVGWHRLPDLGLVIDFEAVKPKRRARRSRIGKMQTGR